MRAAITESAKGTLLVRLGCTLGDSLVKSQLQAITGAS